MRDSFEEGNKKLIVLTNIDLLLINVQRWTYSRDSNFKRLALRPITLSGSTSVIHFARMDGRTDGGTDEQANGQALLCQIDNCNSAKICC